MDQTRASRPYATLLLVGSAVVLAALPQLADLLAWKRAEVARGELWRVITGHLVHGWPIHDYVRLFIVDLGLLLLAGAWLERRSRVRFVAAVFASAITASTAIAVASDFDHYVGSSALVCGVLAAIGWSVYHGSPLARVLVLTTLSLFAAKCALEAMGVLAHGATGLPADVRVSVSAHVFGALGGLAAAALTGALPRPRTLGRGGEVRV